MTTAETIRRRTGRFAGDGYLSTREVCQQTGASSRQLDYWARTGIVNAAVDGVGQGGTRRWDPMVVDQVKALTVVSQFCFGSGSGSPIFNKIGAEKSPWIYQSNGVRITVEVLP